MLPSKYNMPHGTPARIAPGPRLSKTAEGRWQRAEQLEPIKSRHRSRAALVAQMHRSVGASLKDGQRGGRVH